MSLAWVLWSFQQPHDEYSSSPVSLHQSWCSSFSSNSPLSRMWFRVLVMVSVTIASVVFPKASRTTFSGLVSFFRASFCCSSIKLVIVSLYTSYVVGLVKLSPFYRYLRILVTKSSSSHLTVFIRDTL